MDGMGEKVVSSAQLANKCLVNAAQVRKDLAYFGEFGIRGVGYYVKDLLQDIKKILGLNKEWRIAVIGVGNLGSALLSYKDFLKQNYKIVAAFDIDPQKVIEGFRKRLENLRRFSISTASKRSRRRGGSRLDSSQPLLQKLRTQPTCWWRQR